MGDILLMLRSYHCDAVAAAVAAGCCNYRSSDHYISYYCRFKIATKTVVSSAVLYYDNYCCSDYHSDRGYDNACLNAPRPQAQAYWGLSQVPFTFLLFAARKFRRPALPCFRCPPPPLFLDPLPPTSASTLLFHILSVLVSGKPRRAA